MFVVTFHKVKKNVFPYRKLVLGVHNWNGCMKVCLCVPVCSCGFRECAGQDRELVPATGMQKEQRGQRTVSCIPGRGRMFPHSGQKLGSPPKYDISV